MTCSPPAQPQSTAQPLCTTLLGHSKTLYSTDASRGTRLNTNKVLDGDTLIAKHCFHYTTRKLTTFNTFYELGIYYIKLLIPSPIQICTEIWKPQRTTVRVKFTALLFHSLHSCSVPFRKQLMAPTLLLSRDSLKFCQLCSVFFDRFY